jgi:hypothetical protein
MFSLISAVVLSGMLSALRSYDTLVRYAASILVIELGIGVQNIALTPGSSYRDLFLKKISVSVYCTAKHRD